jgi:hypothetical protein
MNLAASLFSSGDNSEVEWKGIGGLLFILVVWHAFRLIQLKVFNRWLAVVSFSWATVSVIWIVWFTFNNFASMAKPLMLVGLLLAFVVLNISCCVYLTRQRFREFAVQFDIEQKREKHSRMMQKASQRAVLKELKK